MNVICPCLRRTAVYTNVCPLISVKLIPLSLNTNILSHAQRVVLTSTIIKWSDELFISFIALWWTKGKSYANMGTCHIFSSWSKLVTTCPVGQPKISSGTACVDHSWGCLGQQLFESGFSHWCTVGGWEKWGIDFKKRGSGWVQGKPLSPGGQSWLVAQRGFAVTIIGDFQAPTGWSPEQPALFSHMTLLGSGGLARELVRSLLPWIILWTHKHF